MNSHEENLKENREYWQQVLKKLEAIDAKLPEIEAKIDSNQEGPFYKEQFRAMVNDLGAVKIYMQLINGNLNRLKTPE